MHFRPLSLSLVIFLTAFLHTPAAGLEFRGYADITYARSTNAEDPNEENGAFALGEVDFFLIHVIGGQIDVLSELVIEQAESDGEGVIDLERLQIGYAFNDALRLHVGRFHNILGYWNTAFHHGRLFQTTIERPALLDFEHDGGILPVHLVGVWVSGTGVTRALKMDYGVMAGNGSYIDADQETLVVQNTSDTNRNKAVSANLTVQPSFLTGLSLGASGHFSEVLGFDTSDMTLKVDQSILGAHLVFENGENVLKGVELLSEYYRIRDEDTLTDTGSFTSTAYYVQLGYHLTERFIPYVRYEQVRIAEGDPYFESLDTADSDRWLYGLRFSQNPDSALKAEVQVVDQVGLDRYTRYAIQWAFGF